MWFAHILQKPWIRTRVALIWYSDTQQVGKDLAISIWELIMGKYGQRSTKVDDLVKQFNSKYQHRIFCYADEINGRTREVDDAIKDSITRKWITIEQGLKNLTISEIILTGYTLPIMKILLKSLRMTQDLRC